MGNIQNEINIKEHDGTNEVKGKKGFAYGWDSDALAPVKVAVTSAGALKVSVA
jgi:hypothetical protein